MFYNFLEASRGVRYLVRLIRELSLVIVISRFDIFICNFQFYIYTQVFCQKLHFFAENVYLAEIIHLSSLTFVDRLDFEH